MTINKDYVYINSVLVSKEDAKVSVFDRGFLYGDGVFETMRIYNGVPFRLNEHMERLFDGLKILRFPKLPAGIKVYVSRLIEENKVRNGVLRIAVSRGDLTSGIDPAACREPTVVITAKEGVLYAEDFYKKGFRAIIAGIRKDAKSPLCRVKSANFLTHILARGEANDAGVDEAIILNYEGFVTESTVSNIFIVKGNELVTPSLDSGILPGIVRRDVIALGGKLGLKVSERHIRHEELFSADEAFLTNSLMEIMPLVEIDKSPVRDGLPGRVTSEIHKNYRDMLL